MPIKPHDVFRQDLQKSSSLAALPIQLEPEFHLATSTSGFRDGIEGDTSVIHAMASKIADDWEENFKSTMRFVAGVRHKQFDATLVSEDPSWKKHFAQIEKTVCNFLRDDKKVTTAILVGHTASWSASAIWKIRLGASVIECSSSSKVAEKKRQGFLCYSQKRSPLVGPCTAFIPDELLWDDHKETFDCFLSSTKESETHQSKLSRPSVAFNQRFTPCFIDCDGTQIADSLSLRSRSLLQESDSKRFVLGPFDARNSTQPSDKSERVFQANAIQDIIAVKIGRFKSSDASNAEITPSVEFLTLAFHPETFHLVYLASARHSVYDFNSIPFEEGSYIGKWLAQKQ